VTVFLVSQLRHRAGRALTLASGIVVAAVAFILLTGSAATSAIHVKSTLKKNFRGAYDILVRPEHSFAPLERSEELVRDNYLSGIYGGITMRQYRRIEHVPGVEVAAPIANIGTTFVDASVVLPLRRFIGPGKDQLFRVRFSWRSERGLSRYPGSDEYLYWTRRRVGPGPGGAVLVTDPVDGRGDQVCNGYGNTRPVDYRPFVPVNSSYLWCATSNRSPALSEFESPETLAQASVVFDFMLPVNLAAIDPAQEAKLLHLNRAVVSGRYLTESERPHSEVDRYQNRWRRIPVLAASRSFVDERLETTIERLVVPVGTDVPGMLGAGSCGGSNTPAQGNCNNPNTPNGSTPIQPGPPGHRHATAYRFVSGLKGVTVRTASLSPQRFYSRALARKPAVPAYWRAAPTRYRRLGPATLAPLPARNPPTTWTNTFTSDSSFFDQPTDNLDVQFRRLSEAIGGTGGMGNGGPYSEFRIPSLEPVGRFDPARLPGFSALSKVPLETYYPPQLEPADARTRTLLHGKLLLPSQNVGDYVQQPPLVLTNLHGLAPLLSPARFVQLSPRQKRAPISVVRVRVAGVKGLDRLSQERIKTVAQLIHDRTGLAVDITAGSSPTPITIDLPAGRFGRPELALSEEWVKKGAAVSYLRALDRKDLALFALVLVVSAVFILNGSLAAVRARRAELGTLLTLGWSRAVVFRAVLGELGLIGIGSGLVGAGLAALLVRTFALAVPLSRVLYVLPIALALALLGGLLPAWEASRGSPLDALRPPVHARRRVRSVRRPAELAFVNLTRLPLRTALGATGLALGIAALTILVAIERSFQGTLVGTLLGSAISLQVRNADFVAVGLTFALAAISAADVLYLNLRERAAEFVTLETTGWSAAQVARVVLLEAVALGLAAAVAGAVVGLAVGGLLLDVPLGTLAIAAVIAGAGAIAAATLASLAPTVQLLRLPPPPVLAAE
jgi:putative ABC transport system permease protein